MASTRTPAKKPAPKAKPRAPRRPKTSPQLPGVAIGPTWQRDGHGKWLLPERTLGWQILGWTAEYLRQPDGPDAGRPWRYTDEQARFILWWYTLDERGRFAYRYGMLRRVKGWGKDPVGATLCAVELVGPCRFSGWDAAGDPVAAPHPAAWVLTAAVAKDQTRNTTTLFPALFSDAAINDYRIDLGKEIVYAHSGRCRLDAVTSSPRALEGPRATFTLKNETQHWLRNNEGHKMAEVIARNSTKSRDGASRVLAISNAHEPGEDSDAEHDWEAWQAIEQGRSRATGFLYDSLEAPPPTQIAADLKPEMTPAQQTAAVKTAEASLREGLRAAKGDSVWLDEDRHIEEIYDPRNSVSTSQRFYLNQIVAAEDAWIAPHEYDRLAADVQLKLPNGEIAPTPEPLVDGEEITLGLDPSKTDDHTVSGRIQAVGDTTNVSKSVLSAVTLPANHILVARVAKNVALNVFFGCRGAVNGARYRFDVGGATGHIDTSTGWHAGGTHILTQGSLSGWTIGNYHLVECVCLDTTISAKVDGSQVMTVTDSTYSAGGYCSVETPDGSDMSLYYVYARPYDGADPVVTVGLEVSASFAPRIAVDPEAVANGLVNWNFSPARCDGNGALTSQAIDAVPIWLPFGVPISKIFLSVNVAGVVGAGSPPTGFFVAICSPTKVLSQSADLHASASLTTVGPQPFAISSYVPFPADSPSNWFVVLILMNGSFSGSGATNVTFNRKVTQANAGAAFPGGIAIPLWGQVAPGQTALPANGAGFTIATLTNRCWWVGVGS